MDKDKLYLSALSGGADSTALLLYLLDKGYHVEAVHCNFHLRGKESDRDEMFCKNLCKENGVELHLVHFDTVEYAKLHHESIETAARNLRYRYFFQLANDIGAAGICVAHNRNDQAETILMNLVRGAGIHGLTGMKPVNHVSYGGKDLLVIRPLLNVSRREIENFLNKRRQSWVTDSTNLEDDATRNKFRHNVIPLLETINPSAVENLSNATYRLQQVSEIYNEAIDKCIQRIVKGTEVKYININGLLNETAPETVLFEILNPLGFNGSQVKDIMSHIHGLTGKEWSSLSHKLIIDRGNLIVEPFSKIKATSLHIPESGVYIVGQNVKLKIREEEWNNNSVIPKSKNVVCFDRDKVKFPLSLRNTHNGDRFVPFGMKGSKLVSDFLTDNKVSLLEKRRQLILCDARGTILWVVGRRPDNRFRISQATKNVLYCSFTLED